MLQFNGKPYPLAAVLPDFEAHSAYLAYVVELEDQQCEALLLALNALLECAEEDAGRRYGVCSAVESVIPPFSGVYVYEVMKALGLTPRLATGSLPRTSAKWNGISNLGSG